MASILKRSYTVKLPSGKVEVRKCDHYTIEYRDAAGRRQRVKGYKDRTATRQLAAQLERAQARGETGLFNPFKEKLALPIAEHLQAYVDDQKASGRDDKYISNVERRIEIVADGARWRTLNDITASSFLHWRARAKADPRKGTSKRFTDVSAATLNQYLEACRAFTNWCAATERMPGVPVGGGKMIATALSGVAKVDGADRRRRRALTDEQAGKVLGVAGERALVYRVGMNLGLRFSEIAALQWGDLQLNAIKPYVQLRAEDTKAKRADRLPIPASLAEALRKQKPMGASDGARVFPDLPSHKVAIKLWKADLAAVGIPYIDDQGKQVDFHAGTRTTLGTRLAREGVGVAIAMRRMRHTDARLTLKTYVDDEVLAQDQAGAALAEVVAVAPVGAARVG